MMKVTYRDDFKGGPTILMVGDLSDFEGFASYLEHWGRGPRNEPLLMAGAQFLEDVKIEMVDGRQSEKRGMMHGDGNCYKWVLAPEDAFSFAAMTREVAESKVPCHAYLETREGELAVILSKDEYTL